MARKYELYLGHNIPSGGMVSHTEVREWLREVVNPRINSYTLIDVEGVWHGKYEFATMLVILDTSECVDYGLAFDVYTIAGSYRTRFNQEAVTVVETDASTIRQIR